MKLRLSTLLLSFFCVSLISAQEGYNIKIDSIQSAVLGQNRKLRIFLPEGYDTIKTRLPVIYVLDADGRDQHVVPTVRFLNQNRKMPVAIIVGVRNIDREHDFLPDSTRNAKTGGGADKFMRFFREELMPYIDKNFKAEPYRVLIGHSYGGLFALYALFNQPDLFDAYIAMDPSVWYNDKKIVCLASEELAKPKQWEKPLFITGREGQGLEEMGILPLEDLLKKSAPAGLRWKLAAYSFEDHGSVTFKSVYDGLRYIFDSGDILNYYPQSGVIPGKEQFYIYVSAGNPDLRYTTDGTEPVSGSKVCDLRILLNGSCTLRIKDTGRKYKNLPETEILFKKGDYLDNEKNPAGLKQGLKYACYEGEWDTIPDLSKLTPSKTGVAEVLDSVAPSRKENYVVKLEGYLKISKKDLYYMWMTAGADARISVNGLQWLSKRNSKGAGEANVCVIPLKDGYHKVSIEYIVKKGGPIATGLMQVMETPQPAPLQREILFHKE